MRSGAELGVLVLGGGAGRQAGVVQDLPHCGACFNILPCLWTLQEKDVSRWSLESSVAVRNEHLITSVTP